MTDLEQRAHDISVAMLPIRIQAAKDRIAMGQEERIDAIELYLETYKLALKALADKE